MAGPFGLLGGGGSELDIYGDLFSPEQKAALQQRSMGEGLLRLAGAFGKAAQPSRVPTSFLGSLGEAAGALAGSGDEAAKTALSAMKVGEDVRTSKQQREWTAKLLPSLVAKLRALEQANGLPQGSLTSQIPGAGVAPVTPGAGGGEPPDLANIAGPASWAPAGAPQMPGAPSLNAIGMPPPQDLSRFGIPPRPGQPPGMAPGAERFWPAPTTPDQIPPLPGQQNTGLLPKPLDQVVGPDGQPLTGPGVLPRLAAGGGAPPPFQRVSSTPTASATRGAGGDVVIPSGPRLQRSDLTNVAAPAGAFDQAVNYLQTELGLAPHQARGAVKWMHNVESKLDPNIVNPTSGAYGIGQHLGPRKTALMQKYGPNPSFEQQLSHIKDELQGPEKAALNSLRNAGTESEAFRAWGRDFERPSAAEYAKATGQDYVIPSGQGIPRSALRNVADTGPAPGAPGAPGAPSAVSNMPEQLSTLSAITQLLGLKDPFGSMLETYYKSPNYLREKAITEKTAEKEVGLKYDPQIEAEKAKATQKYIQANATHESQLKLANDLIGKGVWFNKETNRIETIPNAAVAMAEIDRVKEQSKADLQLTDATLTFPGETEPRTVQVTGAQARAIAEGREVQVGGVKIPAMTGIKLGKPIRSAEDIKSGELGVTAGWKALEDTHARELEASRRIQTYGQLAEAMEGFRPGATAETRLGAAAVLRDLGLIEGPEVPYGEAATRALRQLQQMAASMTKGSTSDYERGLIAQGALQLGNTPEAVAKGIGMLRRLDEHEIKVAAIHREVAEKNGGRPNVLEAQRRIAALGPPLSPSEIRSLEKIAEGKVPGPAATPGGGGNATKPSGEIIQNGWRYDATTHKPIGPVQ